MVMSKKEYERMEELKNSAILYEQNYKKIVKQVKDLKSYLRVAIKMAEINDIQDKIIVYEELLKYMDKNIN